MTRIITCYVDPALIDQARSILWGACDEQAVPQLAPDQMAGHIILTDGGDLVDGCHRILGLAAWAAAEGLDLDEEPLEVAGIEITSAQYRTEHPHGMSTPDSLITRWREAASI